VSSSGYEKRDTNVKHLVIIFAASVLFLVISIVVLNELFLVEKEALIQEEVLAVPSEELNKLHEREQTELTSYKKNDSIPGQYRIPIERAMELVVQESNSPGAQSR
jgi:hypothetical protein